MSDQNPASPTSPSCQPITQKDLQAMYITTSPQHYRKTHPPKGGFIKSLVSNSKGDSRSENTTPSGLARFIPMLQWLPKYSASKSLRLDIIAGLVIAFMVIPQSMAYSMLAGLPVEYGLYSSLVPPLAYMIFGGALHLSLGTNAPISILVADSVASVVDTSSDCSDDASSADCSTIIEATLVLTILSGLLYLAMYVLNFSLVTSFVPDPVLSGFTTGASVIIVSSNLKHVFGIDVIRGNVVAQLIDIIGKLKDTNFWALGIFVVTISMLLAIKNLNGKYKDKLPVPIPEQLVVLILSIFFVWIFEIDCPIVGDVPEGMYTPRMPDWDWKLVGDMIQPAVVCSVVTYILTVNIAKALGAEYDYNVDSAQELLPNSFASILGGLTGSFLPSGSFSRSALVGEISGVEGTGMHNFFSVLMVGIVVGWLTPVLYYMPKAIMASIIFVALRNMVKLQEARRLWAYGGKDFWLFAVAFLCTAFFGVTYGIFLSLLASFILLLHNSSRPPTLVLAPLPSPSSNVFVDVKRYPEAEQLRRIRIFQVQGDLSFANKEWVEGKLAKMNRRWEEDEEEEEEEEEEKNVQQQSDEEEAWGKRVKVLIMDMQSVNSIDTTSVKFLSALASRCSSKNTRLLFANWRSSLATGKALEGMKFYDVVGEECFFLGLSEAVDYGKRVVKEGERIGANLNDDKGAKNGSLIQKGNVDTQI